MELAEWVLAKIRGASRQFSCGNAPWLSRNSITTNLDLEIPGLLFLWLVMESVCGDLHEQRVALFSDNSPTVGWVRRLAV
jgi:hypothetical protein